MTVASYERLQWKEGVMFKSASVLSAAVLVAAGFASPTSAGTITPNNTDFTLTGTLVLQQSTTTVQCRARLWGAVSFSGDSATITGGVFEADATADWRCGWLVSPSGFNWMITPSSGPGPGPAVSITGIGFTTIVGNCSGNISNILWTNSSPGSITFSWLTPPIPGSPSPCTITGTLVSSPSLTVN
jgi:hypothetical protein